MSFRCIKAFMHAFSGRFSRASLEGISFKFFVCFIFNVSLGSASKRKNFDIQCNTRLGSGDQFTSNRLSCHHILLAMVMFFRWQNDYGWLTILLVEDSKKGMWEGYYEKKRSRIEVAFLDIFWILQWRPTKGNKKATRFMVNPEMVNMMLAWR